MPVFPTGTLPPPMLSSLFGQPQERPIRWVAITFVGVLLLALAVRLVGLDYNLPQVRGHDERAFEIQVDHFRDGTPAPRGKEWVIDAYPHLLPRAVALLPDPTPGLLPQASLEQHREAASAQWVQLRSVSAWLGWLLVPLTYFFTRRFLQAPAALLASGLIATSLLCVSLSVQAKPHAAAASLELLTLILALRFLEQPGFARALAMGLAGALAVGALHSGWIVAPPLAVACLLGARNRYRLNWPRVLATSLPLLACIWIAYPFFLPGVEAAGGDAPRGTGLTGFVEFIKAGLTGSHAWRVFEGWWVLDPLLASLALLGCGLALLHAWRARSRMRSAESRSYWPVIAILAAFVLPYAGLLCIHEGTLVRFLLPFAPLFALAAGYAFEVLILRRAGNSRLVMFSTLALIALSAVPAAQFARIRTHQDPLSECAEWVEQNVPVEDRIVFIPYGDLPLVYERESQAENAGVLERSPWSEYQLAQPIEDPDHRPHAVRVEPGQRPASRLEMLADPRAYLESVGARWVVIDLVGGGGDVFKDCAERVARFSPRREDDGIDRGLTLVGTGWDRMRPAALRVMQMKSLGTSVEVWRLR